MAISPALRGIPLILPRVKHGARLLQRTIKYASCRLTNSSAWQDVAPYSSRRHSQDFGGLASGPF